MPTEFFQTTLQRIPSSRVPRLALEGLLWVVLGVVFVGALRVGTTTLLLAATFGAVLLTALWARPRIALTVWLISFVSLPVWIGVDFVTGDCPEFS